MSLTKDQVKYVAKLANLSLDEAELLSYSKQLSKILDYIKQLKEVDTDNVMPTYNVFENSNVTRPDESSKSLTQEEALQNSQNKMDGYFVTKGVFNEE